MVKELDQLDQLIKFSSNNLYFYYISKSLEFTVKALLHIPDFP